MRALRHKKFWGLLGLLGLVAWGSWRWVGGRPSGAPAAAEMAWQGEAPQRRVTEAVEVFKKAFWRLPGAGDQIVHAERFEWSDVGGLTKLRWFLEVKPSPELLKYLRDDNAFGLAPAAEVRPPDERPAWFQFQADEVKGMQSPGGQLQLIFRERDQTLFATGAGRGFQRGAPEPPPVQAGPSTPGRLPAAAPPAPPAPPR